MAISITRAPNTQTLLKSTRPLMVILDSDLKNEQSFRYLLEVKVNDATITNLEASGNQPGVGQFDLSEMTESFLRVQDRDSLGAPMHTVLAAKPAPNQAKKFSFVYGEKFIDVGGNVVINTYPAEEYWWYQHNGVFNVFVNTYDKPYFNYNMRPDPDGDNLLLSSQRKYKTQVDDWGVLGCLNFIYTGVFTRPALTGIGYRFFDASGVSTGNYFLPYAPITPDFSTELVYDNIAFYFPLLWENVRAMMAANDDVSKFDTAAYYEVFVSNSAVDNVNLSERVRVDKIAPCDDRAYYEIGYINRLGAWEYHTFKGRNIVSIQYERDEFTKLSDYWNESDFPTGSLDFAASGGKRAYHIAENVNIALNTDYLTEDEAQSIYNMLQSEYVVIFARKSSGFNEDQYMYNGRVTVQNQIIKRRRFDKLIQFTINVEFVSADF